MDTPHTKRLGIALLGCGKIATKYGEILSEGKVPHAHLVCVCDNNEDRASSYGSQYDVPHYNDLHKMMKISRERIDIVIVLTPSGLHAQHALEIVRYKKHIIIEKPMALTLKDADAMIRTCDEGGIKLFVVKQNRFNIPIKKLYAAVAQNRFGKMILGTIRVRWSRTQSYYKEAPWRGTWRHDGGVLANQAIHHIDLLQWLMGPVESVYAKSGTFLANIEAEDTGVAIIRFTSGALGIVEATTATRPHDLEGSISILGEKGSVEIGGFSANQVKQWNFEGTTQEEQNAMFRKYQANPEGDKAYAHTSCINSIVQNILNNKSEIVVDGREGRKSLEIITALYHSIETEKEVFIKYLPLKCKLGRP